MFQRQMKCCYSAKVDGKEKDNYTSYKLNYLSLFTKFPSSWQTVQNNERTSFKRKVHDSTWKNVNYRHYWILSNKIITQS